MSNQLCRPEEELRRQARMEIQQGRLPEVSSASMWGGSGTGLSCGVCGDPIRPDQVEYEINGPPGGAPLRFHMQCYAVWQLECGANVQTGRRSGATHVSGCALADASRPAIPHPV